MIVGLLAVTLASVLVAAVYGFWVTPILYAVVGSSFALMKISVYSTVGLITSDQKEHAGLMNTLEGTFMVGSLTGLPAADRTSLIFVHDRSESLEQYLLVDRLIECVGSGLVATYRRGRGCRSSGS